MIRNTKFNKRSISIDFTIAESYNEEKLLQNFIYDSFEMFCLVKKENQI